jgi:ribosomal-protein-alanine N-acetyltransferase
MSTLAPPVILLADDRHLDRMMAVMRASFDPGFGEAWSIMQLAGGLSLDGSFARRAVDSADPSGQALLGFSLSRAVLDEAELLLVAVLPRARGRDIGRGLIDQALLDSRRRGCGRMFLEVRENNDAARKLYHACGFFDIGRRSNYYSGANGTRFAAITMQRLIID